MNKNIFQRGGPTVQTNHQPDKIIPHEMGNSSELRIEFPKTDDTDHPNRLISNQEKSMQLGSPTWKGDITFLDYTKIWFP